MTKREKRSGKSKSEQPEVLKGWQQIAAFLGEPTSVVQRWATDGMPLRRQGRYVETTPEELNAWLGKESGKPVHVATGYSGEGEHRFRREAERHSGAKVNSSRSVATLAW